MDFLGHSKILSDFIGVCNCSMFCCTLLYVPSSFAITLMRKRELVDLLSLSPWCLVIVVWLFLVVPWVPLQFKTVVFLDHTRLICLVCNKIISLSSLVFEQ